ncbi:hypothetical protein GGR54DRAFT_611447 [Hypoxylon sp. NC1633]|nr:hypothetical protein GGR54DRAFT_611447 [Hypoxylon sp. NC1633]
MKVPKVSLKLLKKLLPKKRSIGISSSNDEANSTDSVVPQEASPKSKKQSAPEPPEECPICHDPVGIANPEGIVESWTKLYCGHKFGTHCIQTWLQESINRDHYVSPSCPICRTTAKHPCGHLINPPPFASIHTNWQSPRAPPSPPRQQVRRRLTRRAGHPLRPPPPPRRQAQVVGECRTCTENAEFDARMRRITERRRQHTGESSTSTGSRSAAAIKSIIPSLKRSTNTIRTTVVNMGAEPGTSADDRHSHRQHNHHHQSRGAYCGGPQLSRHNARRLTPPPGYSRRLSI